MPKHESLTAEHWAGFSLDQQILMIGDEMSQAKGSIEVQDWTGLHLIYERVLRLVDLTLEVHTRPGLLRELRLWRGVVLELHGTAAPEMAEHLVAFKVLLLFTPVAAKQIPYVLA